MQAERGDAGVPEADGRARGRAQGGDDLIAVGGHESHLSQSDHGRTVRWGRWLVAAPAPARALALTAVEQVIVKRYPLGEPLGAGGMARVVEAHDLRLDRRVAVKLVPVAGIDPVGRERFVREARSSAGSRTRTPWPSSTPGSPTATCSS